MRSDMSKVIVERPRRGGTCEPKGRRRNRDLEDLPQHESMLGKGRGWDRKELNENLQPLKRFLGSRVGHPWDKVYSEISEHLRPTNAVQQHVRDHLHNYVHTGREHRFHSSRSWFLYRPFYVADDGLLKRSDDHPLAKAWAKERAARWKAKPVDSICVNDDLFIERIDGIWFEMRYGIRPMPYWYAPGAPEVRGVIAKRSLGRAELRQRGLRNDAI